MLPSPYSSLPIRCAIQHGHMITVRVFAFSPRARAGNTHSCVLCAMMVLETWPMPLSYTTYCIAISTVCIQHSLSCYNYYIYIPCIPHTLQKQPPAQMNFIPQSHNPLNDTIGTTGSTRHLYLKKCMHQPTGFHHMGSCFISLSHAVTSTPPPAHIH